MDSRQKTVSTYYNLLVRVYKNKLACHSCPFLNTELCKTIESECAIRLYETMKQLLKEK